MTPGESPFRVRSDSGGMVNPPVVGRIALSFAYRELTALG